MENFNTPSLEAAKIHIYSIDFTKIIDKMVKHHGWRHQDALKASEQYRNFLFLNKKYADGNSLPPSEDIDEFWHNHILDTKQYRKDCEDIFGRYYDHYPYFGIDETSNLYDLEQAFERFQHLYALEFGRPLTRVRGFSSKIINFFTRPIKKMKFSIFRALSI
jgi:hypothetical protein